MIFTNVAQATSIDQLKITSDKLTINKATSTATFLGMVTVIFDDLKLTTSALNVIYSDTDNTKEIKQIIIPGKLKVIKNCGTEVVTANSGSFDNSTKKLILKGNVRMYKEGNLLITDKMIYSSSL
jgi:lipopolysaccharide transport protein LptA